MKHSGLRKKKCPSLHSRRELNYLKYPQLLQHRKEAYAKSHCMRYVALYLLTCWLLVLVPVLKISLKKIHSVTEFRRNISCLL